MRKRADYRPASAAHADSGAVLGGSTTWRDPQRYSPPGAEVEEPQQQANLNTGRKLNTILFAPLLPHLARRTRLFIAPDGDLARLPFDVLPIDDRRFLIDAYQISYLTVGRDIFRFDGSAKASVGAPVVVAESEF